MNKDDIKLTKSIEKKLIAFDKKIRPLPGIAEIENRSCFLEQIIDSIHRIKYIAIIQDRAISPACSDTNNPAFDPLKAAAFYKQKGNFNEAFWLVFLSTHFGKNRRTNWQLVCDIYGGLGIQGGWSWEIVGNNLNEFRNWLSLNENELKGRGKFGNHRKYQSLSAFNRNGTGDAIASYIEWIGIERDHNLMIERAVENSQEGPRSLFHHLYRSMNDVISFGRTAKFDYLTMVGKLKLAEIEPGSTYMVGATGPLIGARLLFGEEETNSVLDEWLIELESYLGLYFGMQVLEDALCNWQKNPNNYIYFGG